MAVTKIHQIKTTLNQAMDYITNPEKTEEGELVSSYNCQPAFSDVEMQITRDYAREVRGDYRKVGGTEVLAHHLIQSFSPEDQVTPELAHELGKQLIDELTEGKFEYVIATHVDQEHIHNHIIFNSVSFYDLKKFRCQPYRTANKIKEISNRLCAEHDLSLSPKKEKLNDSYQAYSKRRKNTSYRAEIRKRLTMCLNESTSWKDFEEKAIALGVDVDRSGKHISFSLVSEGQQRRTRGKQLDDLETFTEAGIHQRLSMNDTCVKEVKQAIEETFLSSDNLEDFSFLLQQEYGMTFTENRQQERVIHFNDVGEFTLNETILPDSYQVKNFERAFRQPYQFNDDSSLSSIEERYREKEKSVIVQQDTAICLQEFQIEKATKDGLLVHLETQETDGYIYIGNNFVDVDPTTGAYTIWLNDKFDYTLHDRELKEQQNVSVKGEGIIRGLETMQGVQPKTIKLPGKTITSISERGVSITLPEEGIERLFLPKECVQIDQMSRSCTVLISENWNYYGQPTTSEKDPKKQKKIPYQKWKGSEVIKGLENAQPLLDVWISQKLGMLHNQSKKQHTTTLVDTLETIHEEKLATPEQLAQRVTEVMSQKEQVTEKIHVIDDKIKNYNQVAKFLVTYENYLPIVAKIESVGRLEKSRLQKKYKEELKLFHLAEKKLIASDNLRPDLTKEKIISVAKNQEQQRKRLVDSYKFNEKKLNKLLGVQQLLHDLDKDDLFDQKEYQTIKQDEQLFDRLDRLEEQAEKENAQRESGKQGKGMEL